MPDTRHPDAPQILTVTLNPTVDICLDVPQMNSEGKNRAQLRSIQGGGGGINVARCLAKLDDSALALHTSGREVGARLDRLLNEEGLPHQSIEIGSDTREAIVITELRTGHGYHIVPPGPTLTDREELRCLDTITAAARHCRYLVLTGSVTPGLRDDFCADIARRVRPYGTELILDIPAIQLRKVLQESAFLVRLDRREAAELIGRPIESFRDARAANDYLLDTGAVRNAISTVGALGAVYSNRTNHYEISAPPPPHPPRSDVCAGDSLVAALTLRLTRGDTCVHACEHGVAAAAATVLLPGTETFDLATADALRHRIHTKRISRRPSEVATMSEAADPKPTGAGPS